MSKNINNFRFDKTSDLEDDFIFDDFIFIKKIKNSYQIGRKPNLNLSNIDLGINSSILGPVVDNFEKNLEFSKFYKFSNFLFSYFENKSIDNFPSLSYNYFINKKNKYGKVDFYSLLEKLNNLEVMDVDHLDLPELEDDWVLFDNNKTPDDYFKKSIVYDTVENSSLKLLSKLTTGESFDSFDIKKIVYILSSLPNGSLNFKNYKIILEKIKKKKYCPILIFLY